MLPDTDRMTRAQSVASAVVVCALWVFIGAIFLQNQQRQSAPVPSSDPQHVGRLVSIFVTHDNQVYTNDNGVILSHVPLLECPNQVIAVEVSESGPFVTMAERPAQGFRAAYSVWIDHPYTVISSRMGIRLQLNNGEHVRLDALCNRASATHMMGVFLRDDVIYLTDMSLGTSVPLFTLEPHCQLIWRKGERESSAYPHEMSVPLTGVDNPFAEDARLAFTFQTTGAPRLHAADAFVYHVISADSVIALSSYCGLLANPDQ